MADRQSRSAAYTSAALTAVCEMILDEYELTPQQIADLAADIPGECMAMADIRAEADWQHRQDALMERGGPDDGAYRRDMIAAGRGHLIR